MAKSPTSRFQRVVTAGLAVAGASALTLAASLPAGAATVSQSANNLIVGSGSSTTYTMMQQLDLLFNNAPSCALTTANSSVAAQPLDFACIAGGGGDPLALTASPTNTPENPWADVVVEEPAIGSSNGIGQITKASGVHTTSANVYTGINFARSSRGVGSGDYTGLNFVAYAEDAISWFHFTSIPGSDTTTTLTNGANPVTTATPNGQTVATPSAAIKDITLATLQSIYNGTFTNWNQVHDADNNTIVGGNAPIAVFSAQSGSGTQSQFKTSLGFDPSGSTKVNCTGYGNALASANTGCQGPIIIFENQLASLNASSVLPAQQAILTGSTAWPAWKGTQRNTVVNNISGVTIPKASAKGSNAIYMTSPAYVNASTSSVPENLAVGNVITLSGNLVNYTVTGIIPAVFNAAAAGKTPTVKTPATVQLNAPLQAATTVATTVSWTKTTFTDVTQASTVATQDATVRADAIFFYSFGKWANQTGSGITGSGATSTLNVANCTTQDCGSANLAATPGYTATLGNLGGVNINKVNDINQNFPIVRYLFNIYSNGFNSKLPTATPATLNYVSEAGFLCKPQNTTLIDPATGRSWTSEIQATITAQGFFPISAGNANGAVNTTPVDEGSVAHPVSGMTLTSTGSISSGPGAQTPTTNNYGLYMNISGTGLAAGYQSTNGNPSGFCVVSTTDGNASS
jgi:ABC-type phosphate transport system substrate-binding protein